MRVPVNIPPGIVVDDTTFSVGQTAWSDMDKFRFWRDKPQVLGGWQKLVNTSLTGVCRNAYSWSDNAAQLNIAFGTHTNLQLYLGGQLYDITPASGFTAGNINGTGGAGYGTGEYSVGYYSQPSNNAFYPLTWSLSAYGQYLMACPRGQTIFEWTNNTADPAAALSNAPANVTYMLCSNTRQVIAFGCNQVADGVFNPRNIRGTDFQNPTQWTPNDLGEGAFEFTLSGSGQIMGARLIGDYIFVWTDSGLYQGSFDASNGWLFPQIGHNCGLAGPNAAVIVAEQSAFWFGSNGQFWGCVLGGVPQIIPCPMQEDVFNNITPSQQAKIVVSSCAQYGEIRMDYPDQRDGFENSRYLIYSTGANLTPVASYSRIDGVWSKGTMLRTAYTDAGPSPYPIGVASYPDGLPLLDASGNPEYDAYGQPLTDGEPQCYAYYHEVGQSADGAPIDAWIQSADFYAGNADQVTVIRGIWPDIENQQGALSLSLLYRYYPQDTVRTAGPYMISAGQSKKDFMVSARILALRYEINSSPAFMRLGQPSYDAVQAGIR